MTGIDSDLAHPASLVQTGNVVITIIVKKALDQFLEFSFSQF